MLGVRISGVLERSLRISQMRGWSVSQRLSRRSRRTVLMPGQRPVIVHFSRSMSARRSRSANCVIPKACTGAHVTARFRSSPESIHHMKHRRPQICGSTPTVCQLKLVSITYSTSWFSDWPTRCANLDMPSLLPMTRHSPSNASCHAMQRNFRTGTILPE